MYIVYMIVDGLGYLFRKSSPMVGGSSYKCNECDWLVPGTWE